MLAEDVAYWFFRLNGCLTTKNFVVHPSEPGQQRTEVDVLAVRFSNRKELGLDSTPMIDCPIFKNKLQLFIVDAKTSMDGFNRAWKHRDRQNLERILLSVGVISDTDMNRVAESLYNNREFKGSDMDVYLTLVRAERSDENRALQLTWPEILSFIYERFRTYYDIKLFHDQWDELGKELFSTVNTHFHSKNDYLRFWRNRIENDI